MKNVYSSYMFILFLNWHFIFSQNSILDTILNSLPTESLEIIKNAGYYRLQLIYTQIHYLPKDSIHFKDYYFHYSDTLYNYPASMVKLPTSIIAVKKTETMNKEEVHLDTRILMDSLFCQKALIYDSLGFPQYPHLRKWIKRMLIISDNQAYTHTYDFLTCKTLHGWLKEWGFEKAKISNKFISKCINDSSYYTPTVYLLNNQNDTIFMQYQDSECKFEETSKNYSVGYTIKKRKRKKKTVKYKVAKTFIKHNDWTLHYSQQLMKYLIFDKELQKINLYSHHRDSLIKYLGSYPREYVSAISDTINYYDTWKKFFIYGGKYKRIKEDTLRSINIIGRAYGFLSETAYVVDFKNNVDFIVSASIYVNSNNIMDGKYNYELAYNLFYQISRLIYEYEKKYHQKRTNKMSYYEELFHQK